MNLYDSLMILRRISYFCLDAPALALAATSFTGQVVGISDGDTLSVMQQGKAVKVRLHGIDTPEKRQPFGTKAQQFTADLAFKQRVTVPMDLPRVWE